MLFFQTAEVGKNFKQESEPLRFYQFSGHLISKVVEAWDPVQDGLNVFQELFIKKIGKNLRSSNHIAKDSFVSLNHFIYQKWASFSQDSVHTASSEF